MTNKKFENFVNKHSIISDLLYNSNALSGEVGEIANIVKKLIIRELLKEKDVLSMETVQTYKDNLKKELGDALFYLIKVGYTQGLTLNDIKESQIDKIKQLDFNYKRIFLK